MTAATQPQPPQAQLPSVLGKIAQTILRNLPDLGNVRPITSEQSWAALMLPNIQHTRTLPELIKTLQTRPLNVYHENSEGYPLETLLQQLEYLGPTKIYLLHNN